MRRGLPDSTENKEQWDENLAIALELKIKYEELMHHLDVNSISEVQKKFSQPMLFLGVADWGYGWIFPNQDMAVIGICGLQSKSHKKIVQKFEKFLEEVGIQDVIEKTSVSGYPLPYGNFIEKPAHNNTLLVGDAGGFAEPILGEGIFYAHRTAELAAHAIDVSIREGNCAEGVYLDLIQRYIVPEMKHAKVLRDLIYSCLDHHIDQPISFFISLFGERLIEIVHGRRRFNPFQSGEDYYGRIKG
ncbi:hypothetical protein CUJ86_03580 [Methanofollis fontis]|uniref:NAD(P)/FAD-dependent oxidoreductase n=1 Tax=Methanofollis fontis TaxID=2052832 RepID=A0A483CW74_9EURY|nr:hypothetical protein CUJ86_03580 [Methanofollis fontis]